MSKFAYVSVLSRGVEFGPDGCKMWNRDVRATAEAFGSICLRPPELAKRCACCEETIHE